jgi:hypothetical protein
MLAFDTGGVEGLLCMTRTIPTPKTTPMTQETTIAFVILHIIASPGSPASNFGLLSPPFSSYAIKQANGSNAGFRP